MFEKLKYCSRDYLAGHDHELFEITGPAQLAEAADEASQLADAAYRKEESAVVNYVERLLYVLHVKNRFAPPVRSIEAVIWSTLITAKLTHCLAPMTLDDNASFETQTSRFHTMLDAVDETDHPLISDLAMDSDLSGLKTYTKNWYCSTHGFTTQLLSLTQRCNGISALRPVFSACLENIHDEFFGTPHPQLRSRWPERLGIQYNVEAALNDSDYLTEAFSVQNFRTGIACLSDPTYALGSFYSVEAAFPAVCRRMYPALRARGFAEEDIETFRIHDGADDEHTKAFITALQRCEFTADDWNKFFRGARTQLRLRSKMFDALRARTGRPSAPKMPSPADHADATRAKAFPSLPPSDQRLRDMTLGIAGYPAVLVAHEVGLFRHLTNGPKTKDELGGLLKISTRPLEALLFVSAGIGVIVADSAGYSLTELGRTYFSPDSEFYAGGYFDLLIANHGIYSVDSVRKAVLTDTPQLYGGSDVFKTNAEQALKAQAYTRGMHGVSMAPASAWPTFVDLSRHRHLLDIAGGSGAHSLGAVRAWPHLTAQIVDLAPVCEEARRIIDEAGAAGRITTRRGDMWKDSYPTGADVHLYSQIFHDWPEDKCLELAVRSYHALPSGGRIIVHEILFDDDKSGPFAAAGANVVMLLWYPAGKKYSGHEIGEILSHAGFVDIQCQKTFGYWGVVTGMKP